MINMNSMYSSKKGFSLVLTLIFLVLGAQGFARGQQAPVQESEAAELRAVESSSDLRVGVFRGPTGVGMVQLMESGLDLPGGGSLDFQLIGTPDVMVARLINREVDIAVLPINLAAKLYNSGQPLVLGAIAGTGMLSLVTTDETLVDFSDLLGREVFTAGQGSTPDYVIQSLMHAWNVRVPQDIRLNYSMPYPEITASMIAGRVETAVLPEPFATMVTMQNPAARKAINLQELWAQIPGNPQNYPMTALVFRSSILESHPAGVQAFLGAYERSLNWVLENPGDAGVLVTKQDLGLPGPIVARAIPVSGYVFYSGGSAEARTLTEGLFRVLLDLDPPSIGGKLPDDGFYLR